MAKYTCFIQKFPARRRDGKVTGEFIGETLFKRAQSSKHMLRNPKGWAIDCYTLDVAKSRSTRFIQVTDTDTFFVYRARISDFALKGIPIDRGFGPQIVLPIEYWERLSIETSTSQMPGYPARLE